MFRRNRRVSVVLVVVLFAGLAAWSEGPGASAQQPPPDAQRGSGKPSHGKLTPRLAEKAHPEQAAEGLQRRDSQLPDNESGGLSRPGPGRLRVNVRVDDVGPATQERIRQSGGEIVAVSEPQFHTITVAVADSDLQRLADTAGVQSVKEVVYPELNACSPIVSEGDSVLRAAMARSNRAVDGTGVKVGVLSDSFDTHPAGAPTNASQDVAAGDLPGPGNPCGHPTAVDNANDTASGEDEGRAMAQIVHDLAPGAAIAFETAVLSETSFANNITDLRVNHGANVTVDDVPWPEEPFYQDGPIAASINAGRAAGVPHFSSGGNVNLVIGGKDVGSFEATAWRATTCPQLPYTYLDCFDFDPGPGADNTYGLTLRANGTERLNLQWAEPRGGVTTDLDVFLLDSTGAVVASSTDDNPGITQLPWEFLGLVNGNVAQDFRVVVARYSGTGKRFKFLHVLNGSRAVTAVEYTTSSGTDVIGPTVRGHAGAASAFAVAAVPYSNTSAPEDYSSKGPVTVLFGPVPSTAPLPAPVTVAKPDFTATDCTQNSFFGGGSPPRFCGTSAAAPHAAAVAALLRQAKPSATPSEIGAALASTARPVGSYPSSAVGAGLIDADAAVGALVPSGVDLSVTHAVSPTRVRPGANLVYSATARNAGPGDATNPTVKVTLPPGTHLVSDALPPNWTRSQGNDGTNDFLSYSRASYPSSLGNQVFTVTVSVDSGTATWKSLTSTATITSATADTNAANNSATATARAARRVLPTADFRRRTDRAVYRPSTAVWYVLQSSNNVGIATKYGNATDDLPVPADYDGDGKADRAVYRPPSGIWYVLQSANNVGIATKYGNGADDIPAAGDYDGDGKADRAVYRPSTGQWFILQSSNNAGTVTTFGALPDDIPAPADYDGDGKADRAVYRPSTGFWYVLQSSTNTVVATKYGNTTDDIPVPGDYDGDGKADRAVYRPSTGIWFVLQSSNNVGIATKYGNAADDMPVPGDFDGDGRTDLAVYRPSTGIWFVLQSSNNTGIATKYGNATDDFPVPGNYDGDR